MGTHLIEWHARVDRVDTRTLMLHCCGDFNNCTQAEKGPCLARELYNDLSEAIQLDKSELSAQSLWKKRITDHDSQPRRSHNPLM